MSTGWLNPRPSNEAWRRAEIAKVEGDMTRIEAVANSLTAVLHRAEDSEMQTVIGDAAMEQAAQAIDEIAGTLGAAMKALRERREEVEGMP